MKWLTERRGRPASDDGVDRPSPHRGRKDRRRWCKGRKGVEHGPIELRIARWWISASERWNRSIYPKPCFRPQWNPKWWICQHERYCATCGKILQYNLERECPDFTTEVTRFRRES